MRLQNLGFRGFHPFPRQAMKQDTGLRILDMRVDGGMTVNNLLMQMQVPAL